MEVELKTDNYCSTCGRTINLDLYTIPAVSLHCFASTHNCIINRLKIGLSLYRKKSIRLGGKFHKPENDNVKRLSYTHCSAATYSLFHFNSVSTNRFQKLH